MDATDTELDAATIKQLSFKPDVSTNIACCIAVRLLQHDPSWTDEVQFVHPVAKADANCVGLAWRRLADLGLICKTGQHRRSTRALRKSRKGGTAWQYKVLNYRLTRAFLRCNGITPPDKQLSLL